MAANDKDDDVDIGSVDNGKSQPTGMKSFMVGVSQAAATATAYRKQRVFHYADTTTRLLYTVSFIAAIAAGTALPLMNIVFGRFVTTFNSFAVGDLEPSAYMCQVETLAYANTSSNETFQALANALTDSTSSTYLWRSLSWSTSIHSASLLQPFAQQRQFDCTSCKAFSVKRWLTSTPRTPVLPL